MVGRFDVAVVGLGAMGSAALFHLASRGCSAVGIERFTPAHDRGSSHGESRAIRLGYSEHPSYVPLVRAAFETWRVLERLTGETVLTTTGILEAGIPGSRMVAGSLEACRLHGLEHELLDAAEIRRRHPAFTLPADFTGIWQPEGGYLRPERAISLHLHLATEMGAQIMNGTRVESMDGDGPAIRLHTQEGTIEADRVVVAAGPWIANLVPELASVLTLTRQTLCWYRPLVSEACAPGALPVFMVETENDLVYGFPDFAGTGLKCASHLGSGTIAHADLARQDAGPADEARTRRFLERFMPGAAGPLAGMKTCLYTMTPDEDFVLDRLARDPRIVVASPCSGHGFKFASVIGEILADLALDGTTRHDIGRFALARFSGLPDRAA